jgi:Flp pilus assembly protein TadD
LRRRWPIFALVLLAAISSAARVGAESLAPPSAHISDGQTRRQLARIYAWSGKYTEAELTFKRLMKEHPNDAELLLDWASMEAARGHAQDSRRLLASAIPLAKDKGTALLTQARAMNLWGDFYRAEKIYRAHLAKHPKDQDSALALAKLLMSSQRFEEAEAAYLPLLEKDSARAGALAGLMETKWEERDLDGVLHWTGELLKEQPEHHLALRMRGNAFLRLGRAKEAYDDYLRLSADPKHKQEGLIGMGRARLVQGEKVQAKTLFAEAHAAKPGGPLAEYFFVGAEKAASKNFVEDLTRPGAHTPGQLCDWARMYSSQGHYSEGVFCFRATLAADSKYFPARLGLAEALAADRQYDEANRLLADLARDYPGVSKVLLTQARVLAWSRRYGEAVKAFRAMHKLNPSDPVPLKEGARAAAWGKDMDLAWDLYQELLTPPVDQKLAQRLQPYAREQALEQTLKQAVGKGGAGKDGGYQAYEDLAQHWPKTAPQLDPRGRAGVSEALSDLRPAYRIQKAAWLEANAKRAAWNRRFAQAGELYQQLTEFSPGNQEALFDLAQARCALGLCDQEAPAYRRLLAIDPLHNQAGLALKRLEVRQSPRMGSAWSYWREDGRGEAARITRQRADLSLSVPVLCRFQVKASGSAWWERPRRWGGEAKASGFSLEADGPFNEYISAAVSWTHKNYQGEEYDDLDSGFGEIWFNLRDYARFGIGWRRENLVKNAFSLRDGSQSDIWWLGLQSWLTRRLEAQARVRWLDYSDGNSAHWESLTFGYLFSDHPRELKVILEASYRDTEEATLETYEGDQLVAMRHPYWTPQDWLGGVLGLEWRHDVSHDYFCGAAQHYYDLRLNLGLESKGNPGAGLEALWHWDFAQRWDLEARAMVYRSKEWDADGVWLNLGYRF